VSRFLARTVLAMLTASTPLASCSAGSAPSAPRPVPSRVELVGVDTAQQRFERTRAAALGAVSDLSAAAQALDAQDGVLATGDRDQGSGHEAAAARAAQAATTQAGSLPGLATAYDGAIGELATASRDPGLSPAQRAAVQRLVTAAGREGVAVRALAAGQRGGWSAYSALAAAQQLWLSRAQAGFYPTTDDITTYDQPRAAGAYVVLANPGRAALARERTALAAETRALAAAQAAVAGALTAANAALAGLTGLP